ncbi:hypothetical protein [Erwinia sp. HDF1-3R]|uniref:hypothetical protein n=1 Tax=Erwinia TaxID=551 RepID=UPI0031F4C889
MSVNWNRYLELVLTDKDQQNYVLGDLKITFTITTDVSKPGSEATIALYNLAEGTRNKILKGEFTRIKVVAGYQGIAPAVQSSEVGVAVPVSQEETGQSRGLNYGEIFSGEIRYATTQQESTPDYAMIVHAVDGHRAALTTTLKSTLAAGYRPGDVYSLTLRNFDPAGVTSGATGTLPDTRFPRGRVFYQTAAQTMDNVAAQCRSSWQFVDGKLQMVPEESYLSSSVVLNYQSGLIGVPSVNIDNGITVKCLINPNIRLHGTVEIKRSMLTQDDAASSSQGTAAAGANDTRKGADSKSHAGDLSSEGVYIVKSITYDGDTRGTNWYMTLLCIARENQTLINLTPQKAT